MTPEQLRHMREAQGLTRDELAAQLAEHIGECSGSAIVKWERGERGIPPWVERAMFSKVALKLPIEDLSALLDYAREKKISFQTLLAEAIRERIKGPPAKPVHQGLNEEGGPYNQNRAIA